MLSAFRRLLTVAFGSWEEPVSEYHCTDSMRVGSGCVCLWPILSTKRKLNWYSTKFPTPHPNGINITPTSRILHSLHYVYAYTVCTVHTTLPWSADSAHHRQSTTIPSKQGETENRGEPRIHSAQAQYGYEHILPKTDQAGMGWLPGLDADGEGWMVGRFIWWAGRW